MARDGFAPLPGEAAWVLEGAHQGFEVARFSVSDTGVEITGTSAGVAEGATWQLGYSLTLDEQWRTRSAVVTDADGHQRHLACDERQRWTVNGRHEPTLDGLDDVDLEASSMTNTLAVHRLRLAVGEAGRSLAVYVRTAGLRVESLEQEYGRLPDVDGRVRFAYTARRFDFSEVLDFAADGLVVRYPGIGRRVH